MFKFVAIDPETDAILAEVDLVGAPWTQKRGHQLRTATEMTIPAGSILEMRHIAPESNIGYVEYE